MIGKALVALVVGSAVCVFGCGDSSGNGGQGGEGVGGTPSDGGGGASGSDWDAYCDARAALCTSFDAAPCKAQESCAKDVLKDAIEEALFACLETECSNDDCLAVAIETPLSDQGETFLAACQAWVANCPEDSSDDLCAAAYYVADETLSELETCVLAPTCGDATTCLDPLQTSFDACESWL